MCLVLSDITEGFFDSFAAENIKAVFKHSLSKTSQAEEMLLAVYH